MIRLLADDDKPREKALIQGIGVLSDAELLAILLRTGVTGKNVIEVSRDILAKYGNDLSRLARATPRELTQLVPGIGPAKAITVIAALELGSRCRGAMAREKQTLTSSRDIYNYMRHEIEDIDHEEFWAIMLNKKLGIECREIISSGGLDATVVDIRLLMKKALDAHAAAIAVVHNHPSGGLKPSCADDSLTKRIKSACDTLDIRLIDHVIISPTGYYSYSDNGQL